MDNTYFANFSITMYGIRKCSGSCLYCSAAHTMGYREPANNALFRRDWDAVKETLDKDPQIIEGNKHELKVAHIDIWGGNPAENFEPFKETIDFLKKYFSDWDLRLNTSGNGLELQSKDILNYLIKNNIGYQLSHDGYGQWVRTGEIDPLYWDKTAKAIVKLAKKNLLTAINCTLNKYNYSFYKNIEYFNAWRKKNKIMDNDTLYIKLNHIYDGTAPIDKINTFGHWQDSYDRSLAGTKIGSVLFTGKILEEYLHEFKMLYYDCTNPIKSATLELKPYVGYITEQGNRFASFPDENDLGYGCCRSFQRGLTKTNFVIDTIGKYSECNLIDSSVKTLNSGGYQPDYCKSCKYKLQRECNPCGSEKFPETCEYRYRWVQTLEEIFNAEIRFNTQSNSKGCNCNGDCKEPTPPKLLENISILDISCKHKFDV